MRFFGGWRALYHFDNRNDGCKLAKFGWTIHEFICLGCSQSKLANLARGFGFPVSFKLVSTLRSARTFWWRLSDNSNQAFILMASHLKCKKIEGNKSSGKFYWASLSWIYPICGGHSILEQLHSPNRITFLYISIRMVRGVWFIVWWGEIIYYFTGNSSKPNVCKRGQRKSCSLECQSTYVP